MAAEVRIRNFSSTDDDYTTAFLQTSNSAPGKNGSAPYQPYVNEDDMSTEEDDVFIRDPVKHAANGKSLASKPLLHPRQRVRALGRVRWTCHRILWPALYLLIILMAIAAFVCLIIYIINVYAVQVLTKTAAYQAALDRLNASRHALPGSATWGQGGQERIVGCSQITVEDIWVAPIAKLLTESAIRLVDVNQDGVLDAVMGFATGADKHQRIPEVVCDMYFNGSYPCSGGILALDGRNGRQIWRHYTVHEIFAVTCEYDFDDDGVEDCFAAGRAGIFQAVSGRSGRLLWDFQDSSAHNKDMNLYTPQVIADVDEDGIPDVLQVHGGDPLGEPGSKTRLSGKILIFSGATGRVIQELGVPDGRESYFSPVIYTRQDGTHVVLFGTGGETHPGALWVVRLSDLIKGSVEKAQRIYWDHFKGVMTPPVLIDLTRDGVRDIVIAPFNSTVLAIDGETYKILWKFSYAQAETYCTPSPGYYNEDDVPDFMVKFAFGPGFPIYYHAVTTVLDGRTGQPLIEPFIRETVGGQTSPLTISVEGQGHDIFLYWIADCLQHEGVGGEFTFVKGTNVHEQSRSDFCRLRFKSRGFTKMFAISRHTSPPGVTVYSSEDRKAIEHAAWVNTTEEALRYLARHPEKYAEYQKYMLHSRRIEAQRPGFHSHQKTGKSNSGASKFNHDGGKNTKKILMNNIIKKYDGYGNYGTRGNHNGRYLYGNRNYGDRYDVGDDTETTDDASEFGYLQNLLKSQDEDQVAGRVSDVLSQLVNRNLGADTEVDADALGGREESIPLYRPHPIRREQNDKAPSVHKRVLHPDKVKTKKTMKIYDESLQSFPEMTNAKRNANGDPSEVKNNPVKKTTDHGAEGFTDSIRNLQQKLHIKNTNREPRTGRLKQISTDSATRNILQNSDTASFFSKTNKLPRGWQDGGKAVKSTVFSPSDHKLYDSIKGSKTTGNLDSGGNHDNRRGNHNSGGNYDNRGGNHGNRQGNHDNGENRENGESHDNRGGQTEESLPDVVKDFLEKEKARLEKSTSRKRGKRHVGPHDSGGLQRLISTGTLAPPLLATDHPDYAHSMDLIFGVYWFYPAKTRSILPEDQKCIDGLLANETIRFSPTSKYYGMDHDAYQHAITDECLDKSGHQMDEHGEYESQMSYNPYNVHMGQMTVYRLRLKCRCGGDKQLADPNTRCSRILPYHKQEWPAYMGRHADSRWHARNGNH